MAPQPVCHQRDLSHSPRWRLIAGLLLACCALPAAAQQSTRYEQFELHHSIVYTTFLSPEVAAEYGIARGADKAILTLSVRDADSGDIAGRPMKIEGRTWDLITGGDMQVKEIRDALMAAGKSVTYANIETDNGHDGFLLPNPHYEQLLGEWMRRVGPA